MKTELMTVTPSLAAKWLHPSTNRENRHLRQSHVEFLAKEILADKWQVTHQGIAFADDGRLLDGQHRLAAIVRAGVAVKMQVTSGMDDESFKVIDCGLVRAHFDRIHLVDNQAENKAICVAISTYLKATRKVAGAMPVSAIEDEFLDKSDAWMWVGSEFTPKVLGLSLAHVLAALAIYRHYHPEKAEQFSTEYRTGANLGLGSPSLALRNAVLAKGADLSYWHAVWAMRNHLTAKKNGDAILRILPATEDLAGNKSVRLIQQRTAAGVKSAATKKAKG